MQHRRDIGNHSKAGDRYFISFGLVVAQETGPLSDGLELPTRRNPDKTSLDITGVQK